METDQDDMGNVVTGGTACFDGGECYNLASVDYTNRVASFATNVPWSALELRAYETFGTIKNGSTGAVQKVKFYKNTNRNWRYDVRV